MSQYEFIKIYVSRDKNDYQRASASLNATSTNLSHNIYELIQLLGILMLKYNNLAFVMSRSLQKN